MTKDLLTVGDTLEQLGLYQMLCPGTQIDCDNPGCRHGGCQGRLPQLPLFQRVRAVQPEAPVGLTLIPRADRADQTDQEVERIAA